MSGIVGILNKTGAPLETTTLRAMTDFLAYRGPDGQNIWEGESVGLGHSLLRTGQNMGAQPTHLDGLLITADVHLDSVHELRKQLEAAGRRIEGHAPDPMLLLHAYAAWGSNCVEYLRGDFAFAIWDSSSTTLFCARDHFGIKPFYYADFNDVFLFSNTLNCLRRHPRVLNELNEVAIGDFLLFGLNYDNATTAFRDIQRLPPAHSLWVSSNTAQTRCYWHPPTQGRIRFDRAEDYVENFNQLLHSAVADRLPPDRAGILLSGGLDSGSVAAAAVEISKRAGGLPELFSYTVGYDSSIPDNEGSAARVSADYLGIPNVYTSLDDKELIKNWDDSEYRSPEPVENPFPAGLLAHLRIVASNCRVALSGEGADNLMYFQMWPHIQELRRNGEWYRLLRELTWFLWIRPFPWRGIASQIRSLSGRIAHRDELPAWINPRFALRAGLDQRWRELGPLNMPALWHASRPKAHASMLLPHWSNMFELQDPGVTRCPTEVRYPFLDLRMVEYLLAVPAFPWAYKKQLLRRAMIGRLPESLRLRPKTPLSEDPLSKMFQEGKRRTVEYGPGDRIREFVHESAIDGSCGNIDSGPPRAYCLNAWLRTLS
jgi:asparagine synthase (glutamine-hydrolysing)